MSNHEPNPGSSKKTVTISDQDIVQIAIGEEQRAFVWPARFLVAMHKILCCCAREEEFLELEMVGGEYVTGWQARIDGGQRACGEVEASPWLALQSLADQLRG